MQWITNFIYYLYYLLQNTIFFFYCTLTFFSKIKCFRYLLKIHKYLYYNFSWRLFPTNPSRYKNMQNQLLRENWKQNSHFRPEILLSSVRLSVFEIITITVLMRISWNFGISGQLLACKECYGRFIPTFKL